MEKVSTHNSSSHVLERSREATERKPRDSSPCFVLEGWVTLDYVGMMKERIR